MESFMKKFVSVLLTDTVNRNSQDPSQVNDLYKTAKRGRHRKADIIFTLKSTKVTELAEKNPNSPLYSCLKNPGEKSFSVVKEVFLENSLPVEKIWIENSLLCFSIRRKELLQTTLREVIETGQHYGKLRPLHMKKILIIHDTSSEKTSLAHVYRGHVILNHVVKTLKFVGAEVQLEVDSESNLCKHPSTLDETGVREQSEENASDLNKCLVTSEEERLKLRFVCNSKSFNINSNQGDRVLKYMHLVNTKTGKAWKVTAEDYFKIISNELRDAMELKYGDIGCEEGMEILTKQACQCMTLHLLSKTYSDDLKVQVHGGTPNSKDWAFVLYNYARLRRMFEKFEEQVARGVFAPIPNIEDVDFALLRHDEEWVLVWEYIISWPEIVEEFVTAVMENTSKMKTSATTSFMHRLSHSISVYYNRFHVLASEPLPHLMPLMYARLYLLKAVLLIMDIAFDLLGIDSPPDYM